MKSPIPLPCQTCGSREPVLVDVDGDWWEWVCPKCSASNTALRNLDWSTGTIILERATHHRQQSDYSTSIVFSAMALEAELARLYFKWRGIDAGLAAVRDGTHPPWAGTIPKPPDEELEEELRKLGPIDEKIEAVSLFLDPRGIDQFAQQSDLADRIKIHFPTLNIGSLAKDIQRAVFWRRNRVVHAGYTEHGDGDARTAQNCADVGIHLLKQMDLERRKRTGL